MGGVQGGESVRGQAEVLCCAELLQQGYLKRDIFQYGCHHGMTSCQAAMTRRGSTARRNCLLAVCLLEKLLVVML